MKRIGGLPPNGIDFISLDGAANLPYDIPNIRMEYIEHDPGIPFGFWRSVGASFQGFVIEAFIDELAAAAGKDPYQFRRDLLAKHPRHLAALNLAAEKAGWSKPLPAGRGRGSRDGCFAILSQVTEVMERASTCACQGVCSVAAAGCSTPTPSNSRWKAGSLRLSARARRDHVKKAAS